MFEERRSTATWTMLGKCAVKTCRLPKRLTLEVTSRTVYTGYGRTEWRHTTRLDGQLVDLSNGRIFLDCPACGRPSLVLHRLHGQVKDSVPCDARCTGATGNCCECSCGGKNHGSQHG
jgi:hypothetical protein